VANTDTRKMIRMTPEEASNFLDSAMNAALATIDRDGYPHLVAMSFARDTNGDIVMTSFGKAQKVLNLRRNPRAAVMVDRGVAYDKLQGVMIRGRAEIVEERDAVLAAMRLVMRKQARLAGRGDLAEGGEEISETYRRQAAKRVAIRIKPEKWASWDHAKIAAASHARAE
jgi:PPOX class probable F420-dependent enzyme